MEQIEDIRVVLKFHSNDKIPADLVARIISSVDSALKESEQADFETIRREVPQVPREIIQAVEDGLQAHQFKGMYLETAETGSIILTGVVAATASWILLNTVGESFKDAWKETETHEKVKEILLAKQVTKVDEIIQRIRSKLNEEIALEIEGVNLEFGKAKEFGVSVVYLVAEFQNTYAGTRSELTFKDDDDAQAISATL